MRTKLQRLTKAAATSKSELPIGRIAGLFGIQGELKCDPTSAGRAVFSAGALLRCEVRGRSERVTIVSVREHKGRLLIALDAARDATSAERFIGATFFAPREMLDVEAGEYLDIDLVGCSVRDPHGKAYGVVERVEHYPSSDMLIVAGRMLPMVRAFVRAIDTKTKEIVVDDLPEGLLD